MRLVKVIFVISSLAFFSVSHANCDSGSELIFSCTTQKGKVIQVCDSVKTIDYSFGIPSKNPEIALMVKRNLVTTTQWAGVGSWINYSVEIPNANTLYSVFWAANRNSDKHEIEAGVNVIINNKNVATVNCSLEKDITNNIEGINLKPSEFQR